MNVEIDDKEIAMAVLNGLPARFESLIVALDAVGSEDKMFSLEFVKSRLLQEEQRAEMKDKPFSSNKDSALMNRVPGAGRPSRDMHCTNCGRSGHTASHCWGKDINCRRPTPPTSYKSGKNQDRKPAAFVSHEKEETPPVTFESDQEYTCLITKIEQSTVQSHSASWLLDSACTVGNVEYAAWNMHCTIVQYCKGGRYAWLGHWWIRNGRALARRTDSTCCIAVTRAYTSRKAHRYTCMFTVIV